MSTLVSRPRSLAIIAPAIAIVSTACVSQTAYERDAHKRLVQPMAGEPAPTTGPRPDNNVRLDGTLRSCIAYALRHHPRIDASAADWRAAVHEIAEARRFPDPTISYGVFARPVETRVGPQQQRVGVRQAWPWPEKRAAAADAASERAAAGEQRMQATRSSVRRQVAEAYWRLWSAQRERAIESRQRDILAELTQVVRARIEIGRATVANLALLDVELSRRDDALAARDARIANARAVLRRALGAPVDTTVPDPVSEPALGLPGETDKALQASARSHPRVHQYRSLMAASLASERAENARSRPDLMLSLDYTQIGPARIPDVDDSGKDAVMVGFSMTLPLWLDSYASGSRRARAQADGHRARQRAAADHAMAELELALTDLRDSARRSKLYRDTLLPQAQTAYEAILGTYHTGHSGLADLFKSHGHILDLRLQRVRAMAAHAIAWARLEDIVGRPVGVQKDTAKGSEVQP